jgi:hypothetical protein
MDVQGLGKSAVFLEGPTIPMRMASAKRYREPRRWACQSAHYRTQGLANPQTQFVAESQLLAPRDTVRLKYQKKQPQKITTTTVKKERCRTTVRRNMARKIIASGGLACLGNFTFGRSAD